MKDECCAHCKFFTTIGDSFSTGSCDEDDVVVIVTSDDWCECFEWSHNE